MTNDLLTPSQVAALIGVTGKTVSRWEKEGKLTAVRTPGGHRRFRRDDVNALLQAKQQDRQLRTTRTISSHGTGVSGAPTPSLGETLLGLAIYLDRLENRRFPLISRQEVITELRGRLDTVARAMREEETWET